jgi:diguanylate cyclase (GGDEF)-like protein/PAS domain S-box-containing protein
MTDDPQHDAFEADGKSNADHQYSKVTYLNNDALTEHAQAIRLRLTSSVFTHTSEAIVITDDRGIIIEANDAFTRITGYRRDEAVGRTARMFGSSRQGPEVFTSLWHALTQNDHCQGEVWSRRKDGEACAVLLTVNTVRNTAGQIQNYVALFADITQFRTQHERLERLVHFDALTDLPNRMLLSNRLDQAIVLCKRYEEALAVVYLDLDGFRDINDRYGRDVGDELLIAVSYNMRCALRAFDTLARMGADEFVAVLVDIRSTQNCCQIVEQILKACAEPVTLRGREMQISASIGVTIYPNDGANADQLIRHADQAMYQAKQAGKNRYHLFDAVFDSQLKSREEQLERIAQALESREFVLYYQPKVNLRTGAVIGVEALIRWQHPDRGVLSPAAFLPLIEGHPLSDNVGSWVIDNALSQMTEWRKLGLEMPVSVNLAAKQLQQESFVPRLADLLAHHADANPNDLEFEILESSALEDINKVSVIMTNCQRLGVHFSIDDFGTGYSSLTYLKNLPAETLKIDQSVIRDMLDDHEDLAVVQGVIGVAAAFRRKVIAEGVETVEQGERLLELGCELAQGYFLSHPMPAEQLPEWALGWRSQMAGRVLD